MARGPAPKPAAERLRRNRVDGTTLEGDVDKPRRPIPAGAWSEKSVRWWNTWARSAQAATFLATDWAWLELMLEHIVEPLADSEASPRFRRELMAELRQGQQRLGALPEDRARLHWDIRPPDGSAPTATGKVLSAKDRWSARLADDAS